MPLESASFVNQLDQTRPTATDVKSEGDDVMRLIKSTLKNSFPNVGGAMNASHTELNRSVGLTEDIQPRLSATIAAPGGETLNRLPAAASRLGGFLTFNASTGQPEVSFSLATASGNTLGIFSASNVTTFFTNGAERMRIDSSGNVGIGTSIAPWASIVPRAIDLGNTVSLAAQSNAFSAHLSANLFFDGQWKYRSSGSAARFVVSPDGVEGFAWFTSTPGVGGNVATQTERMRIDASGRVGIGTNNPSDRLTVSGGITTETSAGTAPTITLAQSGTANWTVRNLASSGSFAIRDGVAAADRITIDASGNVISNVNTTAPTLSTNQQMVFALTSNTNLRISVRGTDGVTRVANITLA